MHVALVLDDGSCDVIDGLRDELGKCETSTIDLFRLGPSEFEGLRNIARNMENVPCCWLILVSLIGYLSLMHI